MSILTEILGWSGSLLLSVCAWPAAYSAWKAKHCTYDVTFLLLWCLGELLLLGYALLTKQWLLLPNYILNLIAIGIIRRYNG